MTFLKMLLLGVLVFVGLSAIVEIVSAFPYAVSFAGLIWFLGGGFAPIANKIDRQIDTKNKIQSLDIRE